MGRTPQLPIWYHRSSGSTKIVIRNGEMVSPYSELLSICMGILVSVRGCVDLLACCIVGVLEAIIFHVLEEDAV